MALVKCSECGKDVSSQAESCPGCGHPTKPASPPKNAGKQRTSKLSWILLVAIICGVLFFTQSRQFKEQRLPPMPVTVGFRNALLGPGMVLQIKNTSDRSIPVRVTVVNPSIKVGKTFRLDISARNTGEIGHLEGWALSHGDTLSIYNDGFKTWNGSIP
jgi:hypothetical protein